MTEYEIKPQKGISLNLKELWEYKELFYFFTWRDIKVKYKQTILGFLWAVLQPFLMMIIFTLFFNKMLKVPSGSVPYAVFAYSGLILWNVFSTGVSNAGNSMVANANIIKKIYFPRLIIPISSILVSVFDYLMAFAVYIGLLVYYQVAVNVFQMIIFIPASLILAMIAVFGSGSLLAALNVKYRDFKYVIPFMIQALMFLTPVAYPLSSITNEWLRLLMALNPMSGAVELSRMCFPGAEIDIHFFLISCASSVILFFAGLIYFRKTEAFFADIA